MHDYSIFFQLSEHYKLVSDPPEMVKRTGSGRQALFANSFAQLQLQRSFDHFQKEYHDQVSALDFAKRQLERSRSSLQNEVKKIKSRKARMSAPGILDKESKLPHIDLKAKGVIATDNKSIYKMQIFDNEDALRLSKRQGMLGGAMYPCQQTMRIEKEHSVTVIKKIEQEEPRMEESEHGSLFLTQPEELKNTQGNSNTRRTISHRRNMSK